MKNEKPQSESEESFLDFALRFQQIFPGLKPSEIARRLNTSDSVVKNYIEGRRLPVAEMLLRINEATGANIHWLLTGEGTRQVEKKNVFSAEEEREIRRLAEERKISLDEMKRRLAVAALEIIKKV